MKKLLILALLLFASPAWGATRTSIATDNFNRASLDGNWSQNGDTGWGNVAIGSSTIVYGTENAGINVRSAARWVGAGTFTNDQYSKITTVNYSGGGGVDNTVGVGCRMSGVDATRSFYYFIKDDLGDTAYFGKFVNGTRTSFNSAGVTYSNGDTLSIECEGTTIRAMINDTALGGSWTTTDSDISTGAPGVVASGNNASAFVGDNWEGGSLDAAAATVRRRSVVY